MKYQLKEQVTFGTQVITELNIREKVHAGDMRGIKISEEPLHDDIMKLLGRLTGQPDPVIHALSHADYMELALLVSVFMNPGPPTGSTPWLQ